MKSISLTRASVLLVTSIIALTAFHSSQLAYCTEPKPQEKQQPLESLEYSLEADEAGYLDANGEQLGEKIQNTNHAVLSAKQLPKSRISQFTNLKAWNEFIDGFARVDESGEPTFYAGSFFRTKDPSQVNFAPDFENETVLVVSADQHTLKGFMDIELFKHDQQLKAFVFFLEQAKASDVPDNEFSGALIVATIPREVAEQNLEVRFARQSWGRPCSRFSVVIENVR